MIGKIKFFNKKDTFREKKYYIYALINVTLIFILIFLITTNVSKYHKISSDASDFGKKVIYSISQDKIISNVPAIKPTNQTIVTENESPLPDNNIANIAQNQKSNQELAKTLPTTNKAVVAIIVTGVGLSSSSTAEVEKIKSPISIGLSPYAPDLAILAKKLSEDKHELFINIPFEPINYPEDDPGPYGLLTSLNETDNVERLNYLINKVNNLIGVYSVKNEKFTNNVDSIKPIINQLKKHNLFYIYGGDSNNVVINQVAVEKKFNLISADYVIDDKITEENIISQLDLALQKAKKTGFVTIMSRPYPVSIYHLKQWIEKLQDQNINLVGFSEIAQLKNLNNDKK